MNENNQNARTPVADGTYDCVVIGVRRQEKHYGKDATMHLVLSIRVRPEADENAENFYAELPVVLTVGKPWYFYDKVNKGNVNRSCTSQDVAEAWQYAEKVFPDWAKHNEALEGGDLRDSIAWFDGPCVGTRVRAKLKTRTFTLPDGKDGIAHDATLYAADTPILEDFSDAFGKSLAAAGIKIGRAAKKAAPGAVPPAATKGTPAPKQAPHAVTVCAGKIYTRDDAWTAYEENQSKTDPQGEKFWERCAEIVGKDAADWEKWMSGDWEKCVAAFVGF